MGIRDFAIYDVISRNWKGDSGEPGRVAAVSVIGVTDIQWGEAIKAICVLAPGKSLAPEELIHFVASKIARYKKPEYVVFVDTLQKTEGDEIDRNQVKKEHGGKYWFKRQCVLLIFS